MKKVCVIGLGYIGLPTAALLASNGYSVSGIDKNTKVVETISRGKIHIVEPDLDKYVDAAISSKNLNVFEKPQLSDIYIICVPTPFKESTNKIPTPDIVHVESAVKSIGPLIKEGDMIILESTSPVGTTEHIKDLLSNYDVDINSLDIAYCPERVLPGKIISELIENDRVIGGINKNSTKKVADFYRSFVKGNILETSSRTAEMCKLTENSFRDVNIAFANELSMICEDNGVDVWELISLANHHPRVNILEPGIGVGGHCISVDPWFIASSDPKNSVIIKTARDINNFKPKWVSEQILKAINAKGLSAHESKVACLGLSYKPDIDDLRQSPAFEVVEILERKGVEVLVVEPNISTHPKFKIYDLKSAIKQADLSVILVKHSFFLSKSNIPFLSDSIDFCGALQA